MQNRLPRFIGPYAVEEKIGTGGMGVVVAGRHRLLGRPVAIKVRHRGREADEDLLAERFRQGAILQADLDHPHIARVYDYLESPTLQAIVMQRLDGGSIEQLLRDRKGPLDPAIALRVAIGAADALDHAHGRGVIHRDVKPANLMLAGDAERGDVRVTDFGVAKQLRRSPDLTMAGANVGTLWYMPPEQFNHEAPTPRVDVYGLGATLYEMLTGHIPFKAPDHAELFRRFLDGEPPPPVLERNPAVPPALAGVVEQALALDPAERVPSAATLGLLLRAVAVREGLSAEAAATRWLHGRCRRAGELACLAALPDAVRADLEAVLADIGTEDEPQGGPITAVRPAPFPALIDEEDDGATLAGDIFGDDDDEDRTMVMDRPGPPAESEE